MRSKRERKNRDRNSLKRKRKDVHEFQYADTEGAESTEVGMQPRIDDHSENCDLSNNAGEEIDPNAKILTTKKSSKKLKSGKAKNDAPMVKKVSKKEQRKLKQIANEKGLKAQREHVFNTLNKAALSDVDLGLLKSSSAIGQRETKRQRVEREFKLQKAGLQSTGTSSELERQRILKPQSQFAPQLLQAQLKKEHETGADADKRASQSMQEDSLNDESESSDGEAMSEPPEVAQTLDKDTARILANQERAKLGLPALEEDRQNPSSGAALPAINSSEQQKPRLVHFARTDEIESKRRELPIIGMEQEIIEAVMENDVVVLSGETGCGKTTQVPQFLLEAGYGCKDYPERCGMVGVTQPRRVAATASAQRVAVELATPLGTTVGYQIRYDQKAGKETALKFMTDGILLREAQADFLLRKYSCLIIDEAHERSLNTDLLIGLLSRIVPLRRSMAADGRSTPLKLIIMSATLRTEDFVANKALFPNAPPLVHVPARQYPVVVHFSKKTELYDYTGVAYRKVMQIHKQLPSGGILVFLTGQREVEQLCSRLRSSSKGAKLESAIAHKLPSTGNQPATATQYAEETRSLPAETSKSDDLMGEETDLDIGDAFGHDRAEADAETYDGGIPDVMDGTDDYEDGDLSDEEDTLLLGGEGFSAEELAAAEARFTSLLNGSLESANVGMKSSNSSITSAEPDPSNGQNPDKAIDSDRPGNLAKDSEGPLHVLPLYAMLPREAQAKVFSKVPAGHRLIVVATNVAETSLTIPGIRYVVDAGRAKQKVLEESSGMARYEVGWISKASAEQRAGRAGRTGPGHCYRLFSSAVFNDQFEKHTAPEILNTALEGVILVMKAMGIDKVINFPYPTSPSRTGLEKAMQCLKAIGAISSRDESMTELGKQMASLPVTPRHAKLILQVSVAKKSKDALIYAVALAAAMSAESPFIHIDNIKDDAEDGQPAGKARSQARAAHERILNKQSDALSALNALLAYTKATNKAYFCRTHYLHGKNLAEAAALFQQLKRILAASYPSLQSASVQHKCPTVAQLALRKGLAAGWIDQVAKRARSGGHLAKEGEPSKRRAVRYECATLTEEVFLHPNSALYRAAPEFVVYQELIRSTKRPYMTGVTEVDAAHLLGSGSPLLEVSGPSLEPQPVYLQKHDSVMAWHDVKFGKHSWTLPRLQRPHPDQDMRTRIFAASLLSGLVDPRFKELEQMLVADPKSIARESSQGLPRVGNLVRLLSSKGIDNKQSLHECWQREPMILQQEILAWYKKSARAAAASRLREIVAVLS